MTTFLCLYLIWVFSTVLCIYTLMDRGVAPNILSLFLILCPVLNTIYVLCRFKYCLKFVKEFLFDGMKDTWKKL